MLYLILYIYADAEYMFNGLLDFTGYSSEKLCIISKSKPTMKIYIEYRILHT